MSPAQSGVLACWTDGLYDLNPVKVLGSQMCTTLGARKRLRGV